MFDQIQSWLTTRRRRQDQRHGLTHIQSFTIVVSEGYRQLKSFILSENGVCHERSQWFGYAGLIPFITLPLLFQGHEQIEVYFIGYGTAIASFWPASGGK